LRVVGSSASWVVVKEETARMASLLSESVISPSFSTAPNSRQNVA